MPEMFTLVNRTSKDLEGVWDGRHHILPANSKTTWTQIQAEKFKDQNPLMGSEDPISGEVTYLLGIEEQGDDVSPLEQAPAIERWNRSKLPPSIRDAEIVPGKNGIFSARDVQAGTIAPNSTFTPADK